MPWLIAAVVLCALSAWGGFAAGRDHEIANQQARYEQAVAERDAAQDDAASISRGYQQVVAYQQAKQKQSERKWREAIDGSVYNDCKPDVAGLRLINDEFAASNAARGLAGAMSGTKPDAESGDDGRSAAGAPGLGERLRGLLTPARQADRIQPEGR